MLVLIFNFFNLDWICYSLWPIAYGRRNVWVLSVSLKKHCSFALTMLESFHHGNKPKPASRRMGKLVSRSLRRDSLPSWTSRHVSEHRWIYMEQMQITSAESSPTCQPTESWINKYIFFKTIIFRAACYMAIEI